jgi:hypothetical protein
MLIRFPLERAHSKIFGDILRPVARVIFTSPHDALLKQETWMLVDSGADYTLLSRYLGLDLKVNFETDRKPFYTSGIGGSGKVFLLPEISVQLGEFTRRVPVGFLDRDEVPPLLGRHLFMDTFETYLASDHTTSFSDKPFYKGE